MKVRFQQRAAGNCGLYALANLFNHVDFLYDSAEGYGQDTYELNRAVAKCLPADHYLTMDWMLPIGTGRITDVSGLLHFTSEPCEGEPGKVLLLVFIVASTPTMLHAIGVVSEAKQNPRLWVVDSLSEQVQCMSMAQLLNTYHVQGIHNFRLLVEPGKLPKGHSNVCMWDAADFTHITGPVA
jgi:hypothetical protein